MATSAEPFCCFGTTITRSNGLAYSRSSSTTAMLVGASIFISSPSNSYILTPSNCSTFSCLSFHPSGSFIAVGEAGGLSRLLIVPVKPKSPDDFRVVCTHKGEVGSISWNSTGSFILSVDTSPEGNILIHEFVPPSSTSLLHSTSAEATVFDCTWLGINSFASFGLRHVKFWTIEGGDRLETRLGMLGSNRNSAFVSAYYSSSSNATSCFAISSRGQLCQFGLSSRLIEKWVDTKIMTPSTLHVCGKLVMVGGKNGLLRLFHCDSLAFIATVPVPPMINSTQDLTAEGPSQFSKTDVSDDVSDVVALCGNQLTNDQFELTMVLTNKSVYVWNFNYQQKTFTLKSAEVNHCSGIIGHHQSNVAGSTCQHVFSRDLLLKSFSVGTDVQRQSLFSKGLVSIVKFIPKNLKLDFIFPSCFTMSADTQVSFVGFSNGRVTSFDSNTGEQLTTGNLHHGVIDCLEVIQFSSVLIGVSTGNDKKVVIFNGNTMETITSFSESVSPITAMTVTPINQSDDDQFSTYLVTGSADGSVIIKHVSITVSESQSISIDTLSSTKVVPTTSAVLSIAFGPPITRSIACSSAGFLAIGTKDKRIVIYDLMNARTIRTFRPAAVATAPEPTKLKVDHSGNLLLSAGGDRVIRLINLKSGSVLSRCYGHASSIHSVFFNDDLFISAGNEGILFCWKLINPPAIPLIHVAEKMLPPWARKKEEQEVEEDRETFVKESPAEVEVVRQNKWQMNMKEFGLVHLPSLDDTREVVDDKNESGFGEKSEEVFEDVDVTKSTPFGAKRVVPEVKDDVKEEIPEVKEEFSQKKSEEVNQSDPKSSSVFASEVMKTREKLLKMNPLKKKRWLKVKKLKKKSPKSEVIKPEAEEKVNVEEEVEPSKVETNGDKESTVNVNEPVTDNQQDSSPKETEKQSSNVSDPVISAQSDVENQQSEGHVSDSEAQSPDKHSDNQSDDEGDDVIEEVSEELKMSTLLDNDVGMIEHDYEAGHQVEESLEFDSDSDDSIDDIDSEFVTPMQSNSNHSKNTAHNLEESIESCPKVNGIPLETYRKSLQSFKETFNDLLKNFTDLTESQVLSKESSPWLLSLVTCSLTCRMLFLILYRDLQLLRFWKVQGS
ncbi:hypothetical protein GEMRC1_004274 [Eukaryota sp. GEM-RC1]